MQVGTVCAAQSSRVFLAYALGVPGQGHRFTKFIFIILPASSVLAFAFAFVLRPPSTHENMVIKQAQTCNHVWWRPTLNTHN